jgi:hypothetical protein
MKDIRDSNNTNTHSLRFNPPEEWLGGINYNIHFFGLLNLIEDVRAKFYIDDTTQIGAGSLEFQNRYRKPRKMLEIGSYKGESTLMFAASGIFDEIHCIDPHSGYEEANELFGEDWDNVQSDFFTNTRMFKDKIVYHQDYSYNLANTFATSEFDFIYIDGSHEYNDVIRDISDYASKTSLIIAGHDYGNAHYGVTQAVNEYFGKPYKRYADSSWMVYKKRGKYYSL